MTKCAIATVAGTVLAALSMALAAPGVAATTGPSTQAGQPPGHQTGGAAHAWFSKPGQTHHGTYQNDNPRQSASRR